MAHSPEDRDSLAENSPPILAPRPTRGVSITQKLVALIVLTSGAIVLLLASYLPAQQIHAARADLARKAATYGRLVSKQVASAIAFDDRETAREVFDSVAEDTDIESLVLLTAAGTTLHARGVPGAWMSAAKRGVTEQRVLDLGDRIAVVAPVVAAEGPRGTLVIELSTRGLSEARARVVRTAVIAGILALALGALLAFVIARSFGRRLAAISRVAGAVSDGSLDQRPATVTGSDEIALLGHAFNHMLNHIQSLVAQMRTNALEEQARLERLVQTRTVELDHRNADMRLVLDNVGQGFFSVDLAGRLSAERSASAAGWLGEPRDDDTLYSWLDRAFPGQGDYFRVAWEALQDDWMPLEMRIDQLPSEVEANGLFFSFSYKPVLEGEQLNKVLVVMTDITATVEKKRVEDEEQELGQVVRKLLEDRNGFQEFLAEADELVAAIVSPTTAMWQRKRHLHTLKGNAGIFGFKSLARLCHDLESEMQDSVEGESIGGFTLLHTVWARLQEKALALTSSRTSALEVSPADYQWLVEQVESNAPREVLRETLRSWKLEPTGGRLERMAEYGRTLAERLGKGPIEIRIEPNDVRLDPQAWTAVWQSLVHVVRNAVDHGLETQEERQNKQKPETAVMVLRTSKTERAWKLEVEDHGRGIDWERVARAAKKRGLPSATPEHLRDALLADGLSTRTETTDTSGRGVGLSAVKQMCEESGGRISIESEADRGTTFSFEWSLEESGRPVLRSSRVTSANNNDGEPTVAPASRSIHAR